MMSAARDTKWLEQRKLGWYAVLYVPAALHGQLGKKLRVSLETRDLLEAQKRRHAALAKFRSLIDDATKPSGRDAAMDEAIDLRSALEEARAADAEDDGDPLEAGGGIREGVVLEGIRARSEELAAKGKPSAGFAAVAQGLGTPLLLHLPDWLREGGQKGSFQPRTKLQHERTLDGLKTWMVEAKLATTVEALDRRQAGRFVTEHLSRLDRDPKTVARIISTCRTYWAFLLRKGIAAGDKNPWDGQAPPKGSSKGTEEAEPRPFTDEEVSRLLAGPADKELADLMRVAALSGMRLEEIFRLEVRDCTDGWFNIRRSKTKAGIRKVPCHSALAGMIAQRTTGKAPNKYLFDEAQAAVTVGRERSMPISKRFGRYRQQPGVNVHETVEGRRGSLVNFHSFRRWFITAAARAGQPERVIGQVVGHKPQGMTMGVYFGGDLPDQWRTCVEAVALP